MLFEPKVELIIPVHNTCLRRSQVYSGSHWATSISNACIHQLTSPSHLHLVNLWVGRHARWTYPWQDTCRHKNPDMRVNSARVRRSLDTAMAPPVNFSPNEPHYKQTDQDILVLSGHRTPLFIETSVDHTDTEQPRWWQGTLLSSRGR